MDNPPEWALDLRDALDMREWPEGWGHLTPDAWDSARISYLGRVCQEVLSRQIARLREGTAVSGRAGDIVDSILDGDITAAKLVTAAAKLLASGSDDYRAACRFYLRSQRHWFVSAIKREIKKLHAL